MDVAGKKGDHGGLWNESETRGCDRVQHRGLFDKNEQNTLARAGTLHQRAQHGLCRLREIPLRCHLRTEIRQRFHGAHQAPKIFFLGSQPRSEQHTPEQFESTTVGMTLRWGVCWLVWCVKICVRPSAQALFTSFLSSHVGARRSLLCHGGKLANGTDESRGCASECPVTA